MAINRQILINSHNPVLTRAEHSSPLTVGNGEFAFTVDVTGLQTLYQEYKESLPLCTMSQWGWHTTPVSESRYCYTLDDLVMTEYECQGRTVIYPQEKKDGNEEVYDWLRENPHRLNLGRISFLYHGREIKEEKIKDIHQELDLFDGHIISDFCLNGTRCHVNTCCDSESDTLAIQVTSELLRTGDLSVALMFPYGSPEISASDWESEALHSTVIQEQRDREILVKRMLDRDSYYVQLHCDQEVKLIKEGHNIFVRTEEAQLNFTVSFSKEKTENAKQTNTVIKNATGYWNNFWEKGGIIQLKSKDGRAKELERRIILSLYLLAVNSCGSAPPQETGLTCNSWYGKMHLEMYFWHLAWAPLWNHTELLERSLPWYLNHMEEARDNAVRNGYIGCRWPKMIAREGIDCPSPIAPLLIWQQPHIIFMLELAYRQNKKKEFMEKYWKLVEETAAFMADFAVWNEQTKKYDLAGPLIPAQECHRAENTKNPAYEVEYWRYTLKLAVTWAKRLGRDYDKRWLTVAENMADLPKQDGLYLAHENCPATFTEFNQDHPSMLAAYGVLPKDRAEESVMSRTLDQVIDCWQYSTLWGWDFAVMAMTATRLEEPEKAIEILLKDTPKNDYVISGNNRQKLRKDLPLYLPGNGSLLLAIPLMAAGWDGCKEKIPGFPNDWEVEFENLEVYV